MVVGAQEPTRVVGVRRPNVVRKQKERKEGSLSVRDMNETPCTIQANQFNSIEGQSARSKYAVGSWTAREVVAFLLAYIRAGFRNDEAGFPGDAGHIFPTKTVRKAG
jgi:hypothetical protein